MMLDVLLEGIERVDDVMRILGFWKKKQKQAIKSRPSKGPVEIFGSDQIRSLWVSTGRDELRS